MQYLPQVDQRLRNLKMLRAVDLFQNRQRAVELFAGRVVLLQVCQQQGQLAHHIGAFGWILLRIDLENGQAALQIDLGLFQLAQAVQGMPQMMQCGRQSRMVGPQGPFQNGQGACV